MNMTRRVSVFLIQAALLAVFLMPLVSFGADAVTEQPAARQFVQLTQLPGLQTVISATTLPTFLNSLYKICIGAAAVIAVIQIMIAGVQFMTSKGSVSSNEQAKSRIQNAIFGLVLVLSPTIVFGIINPSILNLDLDFSKLNPSLNTNSSASSTTSTGSNPVPLAGDNSGGTVTSVTGTLVQSSKFPTDVQAVAFVNQCDANAKKVQVANITAEGGRGTVRCSAQCTAGQSGCTTGCSEYTAYCSVQSSTVVYATTNSPVPQEGFKYNEFQKGCVADGGNPVISTNSQTTACFDANDKPTQCANAVMTCNPK